MLKGTKVDGVYDADPQTTPGAVRFQRLDYGEYLSRGLKVMDTTAVTLCMDNGLPVVVFALMGEGNVARAIRGEEIGTLICRQPGPSEDPSEDPSKDRSEDPERSQRRSQKDRSEDPVNRSENRHPAEDREGHVG